MNKKLMAAAVAGALAIPAVAFAQSSVTLYGSIDGGVKNRSKIVITPTTDGSKTYVSSTGYNTSNRWGMKGSEDLGGGLKANFKLEGGFNAGDGTHGTGNLFERGSWVGLSSGGNSIEIGRDYTANFKVFGKYAPWSYNYPGVTPEVLYTGGVRASNMVQGATSFNGVTLMLDYGLGEVTGNSAAGRHVGFGGYWSGNGLTIGAAASTLNNANNTGSRKDSTIGVAYSMDAFTFKAGWSQIKYDALFASTVDKSRMVHLGVEYDFSSRLKGRLGYYDIKDTGFASPADGKRKTTVAGVDYSLSKRTTAYAEIDRHSLSGGLDNGAVKIDGNKINDGSTGIGVGIVHTF